MKAGWSRFFKRLAIFVLALVALSAIVHIIGSVQVRHELNALRKAGRPLNAMEIIPPPVAEADNGAALLAAAQSLLAAEKIGTNSASDALSTVAERVKKGTLDDAQLRELDEYVRSPSAARIWDLLQEAARRKACRFPIAWDQGPAMRLPHIAALRNQSRALAAKALVEARGGRGDEAWATLDVGLRLSESLKDEPILISQLVRIAQLLLTTDAIRTASAIAPPTEAQARALARQLAAFDLVPGMVKSFDGERLLLFDWVRRRPVSELGKFVAMSGSDRSHSPDAGWMLVRLLWPLLDLDYAAYLRLMRGYSDLSTRLPREWVLMVAQDPLTRVPRYCVLTRLLAPALGAVWKKLAPVQSDLAVTRAGLLLQAHQRRHGVYPEALADLDTDLVKELPPDPLTGQPLLYRREGDGFLLHGVGGNLKDDGGSADKVRKESSQTMDIVWRMAR